MNRIVILITVLVIVIALIIFLFSSQKVNLPPPPTEKSGSMLQEKQTPTLTPVPIPTSTVKTESVQGTVSAVSAQSISVQVGEKTQSFSLTTTKDIQKFTSGSLTGGDVKTAKASVAQIKVGQEVLLVVDSATSKVISLFILK